jgi:hypothetical protein
MRKEGDTHSGNDDHQFTTELAYSTLRQYFVAQESYLFKLSITLDFTESSQDTSFLFYLYDENDAVLTEKTLQISALNSHTYYDIAIDKWLHKGHTYSYQLVFQDTSAPVWGIFTNSVENNNPNNLYLIWNEDTQIAGQALSRYIWGLPLNWKNVLCWWGFILTISSAIGAYLMRRQNDQKP